MDDAQILILIVSQTVLVISLIVVLIYKSIKLSNLLVEITLLKRDSLIHHKSEKKRDDFLAMMVHELRSPLSVMKGAADLLLKDAQNLSAEQINTLLTQIRTSSTSMLKLVNDILDVSKLESGKFEISKMYANLNDVLLEECNYFLSLANQRKLKFVTQFSEDLPNVNFDGERLKQVMNNIISNAIKFSKEGGSIYVTSEKFKQDKVRVTVSDNGIGIPDEIKHKLFHKFVQGNNNSHKEAGTGLGLVVAKGIVEAHGGDIWIEDNQPTGAKFCFTLPIN